MKDIDFDELDRAVSSVLGQKAPHDQTNKPVGSETVTKNTEEKVTVTSTSSSAPKITLHPHQQEISQATNPVETNIDTDKPRVATPLAVKRRGRFMDVMHPSTGAGPISSKPPHTTTKLEPLSTNETPPLDGTAPSPGHMAEPIAALDETHTLIGAEPTAVDSDLLNSSPITTTDKVHPGDHLLEANYDDDVKNEEKLNDETEVETAEPDKPVEASSLVNSVPQTTPFLADTKVDKRPLGGIPTPATPTDPAVESIVPMDDAQSAPEVPLPRELQPDVVQVESVQEDDEPEASGPGSKPFATNVEAAPDPQDDGRVEGHPLFDTGTYHEPIAAVPGKSAVPGWLKWVIGLALCLIVGAGVGYFLFTAGL